MTTPSEPDRLPAAGPVIPRGVLLLLGAAGATVAIAGIRGLAWLFAPLFLALMLVVVVSPLQARLIRRGWPGWLSTLALLLMLYAVLVVLFGGLVLSLGRMVTLLPQYAPDAQRLLDDLESGLRDAGVSQSDAQQITGDVDYARLLDFASSLLGAVGGLLSNLVFLLTLLFFLALDTAGFDRRLAAVEADRHSVVLALQSFARGTRSYLTVSTIFGLIVAVIDTVVLALIGVPGAVLWGLLAFITNYVPNVGFVIGLVPPALLALLDGGWSQMLLVVVLYCVINFVIQSLIQPKFVADSVGLSVSVTFLALAFWTWALGPLGALLAVPLTLLGKALLVDIDPGSRWLDVLMRAQPPPPVTDPE